MSKLHMPHALAVFLDKHQIPEDVVITTTSLIVGVGTGILAVLFVWLVEQVQMATRFLQGVIGDIPGLFLAMGLAGVLVGLLASYVAVESKGRGVSEVMEAVAIHGGRIRGRVAPIKILASSLTIGSGGSAGREGPIVQVGAALGSRLGQAFHFSNERIRTLVACGAAAGVSATFNAPIAGSIFALEVILGRFTSRYFGAVVISSVTASVVARVFLGNDPAFIVPAYPLNHFGELLIYAVLGVLAALVAIAFIQLLYFMDDRFEGWAVPQPIRAAVGMVLTAAVALLLPGREVLGSGLDMIGQAIANDFALPMGMMLSLLGLKMLATTFTLSGGNSGGVFAPSLFLGAILGGIVGNVSAIWFPNLVTNPGAYAIVGMAAVFAGTARAPITAVLIVFEMSNDYRLILPLMLATVLANYLAENVFAESIYSLRLKRRGIRIQSGRDVDVLQGVTVAQVMTQHPDAVPHDMTLDGLSRELVRTGHHGFVILDKNEKFWGLVTRSDYQKARGRDLPETTTVCDFGVGRERLLLAYPDETLGEVLIRMSTRGVGRLPVIDRDDPTRLLGMVRRADVIQGYQVGLMYRAELQHHAKKVKLRNIDGTEFLEITLDPTSHWVGCELSSLARELPNNCVLVSIRRGTQVIIPKGYTIFEAGDQITAFVGSKDIHHVAQCFSEVDSMITRVVEEE